MSIKQAKIKHEASLKKRIAAMLISFWTFMFMGLAMLLLAAQPVSAEISVPCTPGEIIQGCDPPSFQDIEYTMATCVTSAFALAGLIFGYYFIANVVIPYFSFNPEKMGDAKKAFGPWLGGMIAFFLSVPAAANVMALFINTDVECYAASAAPGFTIFFSSVCTEGDIEPVSVSGILTVSGNLPDERVTIYLVDTTNASPSVASSTRSELSDGSYTLRLDPDLVYRLIACLDQDGKTYLGVADSVTAVAGNTTRNISMIEGNCPYD